MDSELYSSCGLILQSSIYSDGDYSLARVDYQGRQLIAEVSASGGVYRHRWPSVRGLLMPVSARDLPGGNRLLLFDPGEGRLLVEILHAIRGLSEERALSLCSRILRIVTDLQSAGMICGYLGPEMFLVAENEILILAGRRGVPRSPFTPPEVGRTRPSDPRSDVSAMGSLLFRLIAGSDSREDQLRSWGRLTPSLQDAVQKMVATDPVDRPGSLKAVERTLERIREELLEDSRGAAEQPEPTPSSQGFVREPVEKEGGSLRKYWYLAIPVILVLAYLVFRFSAPPGDEVPVDQQEPAEDSVVWQEEPQVSPWAEDTVETVMPDTSRIDPGVEDWARVWVSNCTGTDGLEDDFRAGPASGYSFVYPLAGTTRRQTSIILVRRQDPFEDIHTGELGVAAEMLADSAWDIRPVDLTIMLGTDLSYAGLNSGFLSQPQAPAGTLYVDVVNHGIQYSLDGLGAATWVAGSLEGKAVTINGTEYVIAVSDIRDADGYYEEIGIPEVLDTTVMLRHSANGAAAELERLVRRYFQALPVEGPSEYADLLPPDLHVLIGSSD